VPREQLTKSEERVFNEIVRQLDNEDDGKIEVTLSYQEIANETEFSLNWAFQLVQRLAHKGYIEIDRDRDGPPYPNTYRVPARI
jgi:hypothetical protein